MRTRIHGTVLPSEIGEFTEDVRQVFQELGRTFGSETSLHGECSPAVDVYETDDWLELTVDLPGVDAATVRVIAKGDSVLIAGEKAARRAHRESSFHLVERGYGRQLLLSQDVCHNVQLRANGGFGYAYLQQHFLPTLRTAAVAEGEIAQMTIAKWEMNVPMDDELFKMPARK